MRRRQLIVSHRAESDLQDIYGFIARENPRAAETLIRSFVEHMQKIADNALPGRERTELGDGVRSLACRQRLIFFRVDDEAVRIIRVLHGRRDIDTDDIPPEE